MNRNERLEPAAGQSSDVCVQEKTYTCICCPLGCVLTVQVRPTTQGTEILRVDGNTCRRGLEYAQQEAVRPVRMVTASAQVKNRLMPVSVKTSEPVDKDCMAAVLQDIASLRVCPPVRVGDVLVHNVANTGVDVIATKTVL